MHHDLYQHCAYFIFSFLDVQKYVAKCRFEKSCMNTTCIPSNVPSSTLIVKNDKTDVQALMSSKYGVSQVHLILSEYMQKEHANACTRD